MKGPACGDCDPTNSTHLACYVQTSFRLWDYNDPDDIPQRISQTGFYSDLAAKTIVPEAIPYDVNILLWLDGAHQEQWVIVPSGQKITPTETQDYTFPDGTVFVKNISLDTIVGDTNSRILVETRFINLTAPIINDYDSRITFVWERDQSEAYLADVNYGVDRNVPVWDGGTLVDKPWRWLGKFDCMACHSDQRGLIRGFITQQLWMPSKTTPSQNQFDDLMAANVVDSKPDSAAMVNDSGVTVAWAPPDDVSATLEHRAKSYMASQCQWCHGTKSLELGAPHNLDYFKGGYDSTYINVISAAGGEEYPYQVYPGYPEKSNFIYRMRLRPAALGETSGEMMPGTPYNSFELDEEGMELLWDWISSLDAGVPAPPYPSWEPLHH
jgi:hypothetical protein